jgi:hypothetical protein
VISLSQRQSPNAGSETIELFVIQKLAIKLFHLVFAELRGQSGIGSSVEVPEE